MSGPDDAGTTGGHEAYLDMPLDGFLTAMAAGQAAPGGGSAAAAAVAVSACLCAMTARLSARQLTEDVAGELAAVAERLRSAAAPLIEADADAFGRLLAARKRPAGPAAAAKSRQHGIEVALSDATAVPVQVIELAAQVARLAARLVADGNPNLRGDAITALLLAEAGARAAAVLVGINLADAPDDARPARADRVLTEVADCVRAAL
jgi:formiminotetrahydrofolate cyclodeaminase